MPLQNILEDSAKDLILHHKQHGPRKPFNHILSQSLWFLIFYVALVQVGPNFICICNQIIDIGVIVPLTSQNNHRS